jgi:hypothetical protein
VNIDLNKKPMLFGVSRSGGTFIYNIINEIFQGNVKPQSHNFFATEQKVVATYRDFRDSTVSWWRMEVGKFTNLEEKRCMSKSELVRYADRMKQRINELNKMKEYYPENNILFLRYEEFFNNFDFIFNQLENFLEISISPEMKKNIVEKYSLESQKKEAAKFEDFRGYDEVRHIHGHHIMNGEPKTWTKLTDPKHYFLLNYILKDGLQKWGY